MNNIISLHKNCNLETTFNLDTGELINSTTACGGDLQPPTTFYTIESNVLNITDTNGSENGVPCGSFLVQELQFSADNISYPLVVPFGGTTYDLCGLDISLLGLPTGHSTIYIKRVVQDCGGSAEYLDKADIMVTCNTLGCLITSQTLTLDVIQQELIAKPSATQTVWRLTSPSPAQHTINLTIANWVSGNFGYRWMLQNIIGFPLWWSGNGITVIGTTANTIDVLVDTYSNGWSGSVVIDTCKDDIAQTGFDDLTNKDLLQQAYDSQPIGYIDSGTQIESILYELTPNGTQCVIDCAPQTLYDCWNFSTDEYDIMEGNYSGVFINQVSEVKVNGTTINFSPITTWLDLKALLQAYANITSVSDNVGFGTDLTFTLNTATGTITSIEIIFNVIGSFPLTQISVAQNTICTGLPPVTYICWSKYYPNVLDGTDTGTFLPNVVDVRINGATIMSGAATISTVDDLIAMLLSDNRVVGVSKNTTSEPNLELTISTIQGVTSIVVETAAPALITFDVISPNDTVPCAIDYWISYRCWINPDASSGDCAPDFCLGFQGVEVDGIYYPFSATVSTFAAFEAEMAALPIGFIDFSYQLITDGIFAIVLNSKKANTVINLYVSGYTYPDPDGYHVFEWATPPQPKLTICSF